MPKRTKKPSPPPPGFRLLHTLHGHEGDINGIAWSPDGELLASASDDFSVCVWEPTSGSLLFRLSEHTELARDVSWSPDGRTLVSTANDGKVVFWDVENGLHHLTYKPEDYIDLGTASWSPDGLLAIGSGRDIKVLDVKTGKLRRSHKFDINSVTSCQVAWSSDGKRL